MTQLSAQQVGLGRHGDVVGGNHERLGRRGVRVGQPPIGEPFRQQVAVVAAPLGEIAGEGDHVRAAVHGVPEHVLASGDASDEVVVGDAAETESAEAGRSVGADDAVMVGLLVRGLVRSDRCVTVMLAPITSEEKAPCIPFAPGHREPHQAAVRLPWA